MKFSTCLSVLSLGSIVAAAPWENAHQHHDHAKRAIQVVTVSETVTVVQGKTLYPTTVDGTVTTVTVEGPPPSSTSSSGPSVVYTTVSASLPGVEKAAAEPETVSTSSSSTSTTEVAAPTTTSSSSTTTKAAATTTSSSSTAAATTTSASSDLSTFAQQILDQHNKYRAKHGVADLEWDDTLATYASDYITKQDSCESFNLVHSGGEYGENLAIGYSFTGTVDAWYNEIDSYSFSNPGFSSSTGHFTQVVWKASTKLGCAYKYCNSEWSNYVVCEYDPAGNVIGEFPENVLE